MSIFSNILSKIGSAIANFFSNEAPIVETALTTANNFVNIIKTFLGSATGQTLQAILDALAPGVAPAVFAALNTFFIDFGIITADINKTAQELAADGLNAIAKLTGDSKTLALSNAASIIGNAISTANGATTTLQQHIVVNQLIHNPNVLDAPVNTSNASAKSST